MRGGCLSFLSAFMLVSGCGTSAAIHGSRALVVRGAGPSVESPMTEPQPVPAESGPAPPVVALSSVQATLRIVRPLRLVRVGGETGLDGELVLELVQTGPETITVADMDVMGLRFVHATTGEVHVIVHPCACMLLASTDDGERAMAARPVTLAPGVPQVLRIADFGCGGGMWTPPFPGTWNVIWGVILPERVPVFDAAFDSSSTTAACKAAFLDPVLWKAAAVSPPVSIELKQPVPLAIPSGGTK